MASGSFHPDSHHANDAKRGRVICHDGDDDYGHERCDHDRACDYEEWNDDSLPGSGAGRGSLPAHHRKPWTWNREPAR